MQAALISDVCGTRFRDCWSNEAATRLRSGEPNTLAGGRPSLDQLAPGQVYL